MAFGFPSQKGVKKGMRQNNGKQRGNQVKLRPAPSKLPRRINEETTLEHEDERTEQDEDDQEDDSFTYQHNLRQEIKPLTGQTITVSGCGNDKRNLMSLANQLGAKDCASLTSDTTHLISDVWGSAKCDMALKCRMNIMNPEWLPAVREAWTNAEQVDFAELQERYRLAPLVGAVVALTQYSKGDQTEMDTKITLEAAGATIEPRLTRSTTHLIVASSSSNRGPIASKLGAALEKQAQLPALKIVWEGWIHDCIRRGGRTHARDSKWKYVQGGKEPDYIPDDDLDSPKSSNPSPPVFGRSTWGGAPSQSNLNKKRPLEEEDTNGGDENAVVVRRKKNKVDDDPLLASMAIKPPSLVSSIKVAPSYTHPDPELVAPETIHRNAVAGPSRLRMETANHDDTFSAGKGGSGSIIKALSSTRSSRFDADESTKLTKRTLVSKRSINEVAPPSASAQDDSAFFEVDDMNHKNADDDNEEEEHEPVSPIFKGLVFSIMSMTAKNRDSIQRAILERQGTILVDQIESSTDYIIVSYFGAPYEYTRPDTDARVVTGCWIEHCVYADRLVLPDNRLLERPLPWLVPIEGAEDLKLHLSGFKDIEVVHLKRFIKDIGARFAPMFDRTCTHLIHGDAAKAPSGLKVDKAREWGKPIEGVEWLRQWAEQRAVIRTADKEDEDSPKDIAQAKKGKGKEQEMPRDITNEDLATRSRVGTEAVEERQQIEGCLNGCSLFFSNKTVSVNRFSDLLDNAHAAREVSQQVTEKAQFVELATRLGADALSTFDTSVITHFIYSSARANDSASDFKKARAANVFIVHPNWLYECERLKERVNEAEFPHTLDPKKGSQLAVVTVKSPQRARSMSRPKSVTPQRAPSRIASAVLQPKENDAEASRAVRCATSRNRIAEAVLDPVEPSVKPSTPLRQKIRAPEPSSTPPSGPILLDRPDLDTSSDPPEQPAALQPRLDHNRVVALEKTTSLLLADLAESEARANVARANNALSRRRSHASTTSMTRTSTSMSREASTDKPRRLPGTSHIEPSQFTQGEDTYAVEYDDPDEAAAREALALALGGGGSVVLEAEDGKDVRNVEMHVGQDNRSMTVETPNRSTRASARKKAVGRKIEQVEEGESIDSGRSTLRRSRR